MHPRLSALVLVVASIALPLTLHASNMRFLEFSPSAFFTEKDWELLRGAAKDLLDNHKDGDSVSWKNEESGHNGKLTVLDTYADFGTTCRRMKVFSDAIEVSATRLVNMCRNKEGLWKILN
jgi:surface antigen